MKTAIYKYDYENYSGYQIGSVNIGDYIQSIAASQYFDHVDLYVDRDKLCDVTEEVALIGNGWYSLNKKRHWINNNVNFLPVSMHISNPCDISAQIVANLARHHMPVGCRDLATMDFLQSHGIDAYFSSCLTTTLTRDFVLKDCPNTERKGVLWADANINKLKIFPITRILDQWKKLRKYSPVHKELRQLMERFAEETIETTSHNCSFKQPHAERFNFAMSLLRKYATAKCVITSRIHCALPCLGLGTPVVLVTNSFDRGRYRGLDRYLNHIWMNEDGSLSKKIDTLNGNIINSDEFYPKAMELKNRCISFSKTFVG